MDYILHLITYNKFLESKRLYLNHHQTIFKYVFSFRGIILFLCVLSSIHVISNIGAIDPSVSKVFDTFKFLNIARIIRFFAILSIFTPFKLIYGVFEKQKKVLFNVLIISIFLIIIFALLIWNSETTHLYEVQDNFLRSNKIKRGWISIYESYINNHVENLKKDEIINWLGSHNINQDNFNLVKSKYKEFQNLSNSYVTSFIDSLYFSTITLTTIGYGDFTPRTQISKVIVSLNSLLAIAIVAIPSGVVASEFLLLTQQKLKKEEQERKKDDSLLAIIKNKNNLKQWKSKLY
ncbi:potassium channel family protein [Mycoplasmopsis cynos]|uniref:potassium channel family protein n=1 Tax=Mycoplasmopsis cynos TaxID=171284 RepID=UPI002FEEAE1C